MIVKEDDKQVQGDVLQFDALKAYRHYQLLNLQLKRMLWKRRYGFFGLQGFGTMISVAMVALIIIYFAEPDSMLQHVAGVTNIAAIFLGMWSAYKMAKWEYQHTVDEWGGLLKERSESGLVLNHVQFVLEEDAQYTADELEHFMQTFTNPVLTGTMRFVERPLDVPVVIDGKHIVGAFVEIDVDSATGQIQSTYQMMTDTGHGVEVDGSVFERMIEDTWTTSDGDEQSIPVLTGKHDSLLWGAVGDMMDSASKVMPVVASRSKEQIPVLREAIRHIERVLFRTRKSTTHA